MSGTRCLWESGLTCRNRANELTLCFTNESNAEMSLILRSYDDGFAYRYRLHGTGNDTMTGELSAFHVPANSKGWFARYAYPNYEWYDEST